MKDSTPPPAAGEVVEPSATKQNLAKLLHRINECTRFSHEHVQTARGAKHLASRRAAAREFTLAQEGIFQKHDRDRDGYLSRKEVASYARVEYKFTLPEETIDMVFRSLVAEGAKGVALQSFQLLRTAVGVARERARDKVRRAQKAQKEKALKDMKAQLLARIKEAGVGVDAADKALLIVEDKVKPVTSVKAKSMSFLEMTAKADETQKLLEETKELVNSARESIEALSKGIDKAYEDDLLEYLNQEAKQSELRMGRMGSRIIRAANLALRFQKEAKMKRVQELEKLRVAALKVIHFNRKLKKLSIDEMFTSINVDGTGQISEKEFVAFFVSADKDVRDIEVDLGPSEEQYRALSSHDGAASDGEADKEAGQAVEKKLACVRLALAADVDQAMVSQLTADGAKRLFAHILEADQVGVSQEQFIRITRVTMKVVKETIMTCGISIKAAALRRLDLNEVVEVLDGPLKEDSVEVRRIRGRVMKDGLEGWITVSGNQGTAFLKEGGDRFKVVKETILTDSFELDGDKDATKRLIAERKLKEDEVVELHSWPKKEETSGLTRMKARARSDGSTGWVTMIGNAGTPFLEVL